jgi:hypothetical protein
MIDLATITANAARDRVAEQFTGPAVTGPAAPAPLRPARRAAVRALRAFADRLEPAPRYAAHA